MTMLGRKKPGLFSKKPDLFKTPRKDDDVPPISEVQTPPVTPGTPDTSDSESPNNKNDDDRSHMSDLTEPHHMDPPGRMIHSRSNDSPVIVMKETLINKEPQKPKPDPEPATSTSVVPYVVQNLLSIMDKACTAPTQSVSSGAVVPPIQSMLSFTTPEWGRAPSGEDEEDNLVSSRWTALSMDAKPPRPPSTIRSSSSTSASHYHEKYVDEEYHEPKTKPKVFNENFEMILQEKSLKKKKKKRFRLPFLAKEEPQPQIVAPPHRVREQQEEEKKQEDGEQQQPRVQRRHTAPQSRRSKASKEARYKHLLGSMMKQPTKLETVPEEEASEATELKVRVPGLRYPDEFLSENSLIGEVYPHHQEEKHQEESPTKMIPVDKPTDLSALWLSEVQKVSEQPDSSLIRRSKTWIEQLGFATTCEEPSAMDSNGNSAEISETIALKRQLSAPEKLVKEETSEASAKATAGKPVWKAAVDPETGLTYYYHRLSRKTTWTKPPEEEIFAPSPSMDEEEDGIKVVDEEILRKRSVRDFDPDVWKTKEEIVAILRKMHPPGSDNVEKLIAQYEGREHELLHQLKDLDESRPFDEPISDSPKRASAESAPKKSVKIDALIPKKLKERVVTQASRSMYSGFSKSTQPIRNTGRVSKFEEASHATSISSRQGDMLPPAENNTSLWKPARVPSKIPVPRIRELQVEEFSSNRIVSQRYGMSGPPRPKSSKKTEQRVKEPEPEKPSVPNQNEYYGDEDTDGLKDTDTASILNDSISALSENDLSFADRKEAFELARRRALEDAIAREDWDLAAALSEGMRAMTAHASHKTEKREWKQTELDRFISQNDWDAVANYIAQVRSDAKAASSSDKPSRQKKPHGYTPQKRFGARSQLQHKDFSDDDSWESGSFSSFDTDCSSTSSFAAEKHARGRRKNFAC